MRLFDTVIEGGLVVPGSTKAMEPDLKKRWKAQGRKNQSAQAGTSKASAPAAPASRKRK